MLLNSSFIKNNFTFLYISFLCFFISLSSYIGGIASYPTFNIWFPFFCYSTAIVILGKVCFGLYQIEKNSSTSSTSIMPLMYRAMIALILLALPSLLQVGYETI